MEHHGHSQKNSAFGVNAVLACRRDLVHFSSHWGASEAKRKLFPGLRVLVHRIKNWLHCVNVEQAQQLVSFPAVLMQQSNRARARPPRPSLEGKSAMFSLVGTRRMCASQPSLNKCFQIACTRQVWSHLTAAPHKHGAKQKQQKFKSCANLFSVRTLPPHCHCR